MTKEREKKKTAEKEERKEEEEEEEGRRKELTSEVEVEEEADECGQGHDFRHDQARSEVVRVAEGHSRRALA